MRKFIIPFVFAVLFVACTMLLASGCEQRATSPDQDGRLGAEPEATAQQGGQDSEQDSERFPLLPFPVEFTAEDLYGNTVTAASFGEKQLYYVFFWGTW